MQIWLLPKHSWSVSGAQGFAQPVESQTLIAQVVINLRRREESVFVDLALFERLVQVFESIRAVIDHGVVIRQTPEQLRVARVDRQILFGHRDRLAKRSVSLGTFPTEVIRFAQVSPIRIVLVVELNGFFVGLSRFLETGLIVISCAQVGILGGRGLDTEGLCQRVYCLRAW